jgi:hypothetical protein
MIVFIPNFISSVDRPSSPIRSGSLTGFTRTSATIYTLRFPFLKVGFFLIFLFGFFIFLFKSSIGLTSPMCFHFPAEFLAWVRPSAILISRSRFPQVSFLLFRIKTNILCFRSSILCWIASCGLDLFPPVCFFGLPGPINSGLLRLLLRWGVRAIQDHKVIEWNTCWKCRLLEGTDDM